MLNKVMLIGRLGRDPEIRYTQSGKAVGNFTLATSEKGKDGEERTEWHRIVVWDRLAETVGRYLTKGRQVFIEGRIQTRQWEDQEGATRSTTEIVARSVQFLGSRGDDGGGERRPAAGAGRRRFGDPAPTDTGTPDGVPYADDDDIPF